jgi:hypothetical protein
MKKIQQKIKGYKYTR